MLADPDLLLIAVFCAADDLLPTRAKNARPRITDAEVITLCVARRCWVSVPIGGFCVPPGASWADCFQCCPPKTPTGSAAPGWRSRSSG
jgi:hypothetical protein